MKREIKFRGKRKDNGEWVYGYFAQDTTRSWILAYNACYWDWFEVYPETAGQFTGLLDKNGKEIYEGDILAVHNQHRLRAVMEWKQDRDPPQWTSFHPLKDFEIIGNRWNNQELLK